MLEVFQFINPLQLESLEAEQKMIKILSKFDTKVCYKYIPLLNLKTYAKIADKLTTTSQFSDPNYLMQLAFQMSIDHEAIAIQGRKVARIFLRTLQSAVITQHCVYSESLITEIANTLGVDVNNFLYERQLAKTKQRLTQNQRLALEFAITNTPCVVVLDTKKEYAYVMEHFNRDALLSFVEAHHHHLPYSLQRTLHAIDG